MPHNYLTKSKFKTVVDCPRKLYYGQHPQLFPNAKESDSFLQQLAEGGFQVGELAKDYYPSGIEIERGNHVASATKTLALLQQENVTIYEAAFLWNNGYVLVDVLVKAGNNMQLIEVKAKGYNATKDSFWGKIDNNKIQGNWEPYLYDVAFQDYVVSNSLQENGLGNLKVTPFLMLVDKGVVATVNGINQLYQLVSIDESDRKKVLKKADASLYQKENLGASILAQINVIKEVKHIQELGKVGTFDFRKGVELYSNALQNITDNELFVGVIQKSTCKSCEFSVRNEKGDLSGKETCLQQYAHFSLDDLKKPLHWDIWNFRGSNKMIEAGKYFMEQVTDADLNVKSALNKMDGSERRWLQVTTTNANSKVPIVLKEDLANEIASWKFPLHFIDFEGSRTALPFYKNMKPYEQIAFQFSHHMLHSNGTLEHKTEWLNMEQGYFPNFDFVRALKNALSNDEGTIFKYATYENSVLNAIKKQLAASNENDKDEITEFIETITNYEISKNNKIVGDRDMIDLCQVVRDYYYNPLTNGSNSIKFVLPAILNTNKLLQKKYSQPIYGTETMPSKNFTNQVWIQHDETGKVKDPYKLLHNIYEGKIDITIDNDSDVIEEDKKVANGGAAMAAYNEIQFATTTLERRQELEKQLLRYCELDTLAMAMVYEELVIASK